MTNELKAQPAETREMYTEIGALIGAIGKALVMTDSDVSAALEKGAMTLEFGADSNGNRFIAVHHEDRTVRVYQGAIKRDSAMRGVSDPQE